ncbi:prostate-associated microseminoprotein [Thalassophryne amazonica]|uniref:prostate-associated microseminoprotein n=1 Tax=Thalassophryne amazonica TaxID=390379 RepID=UPI0014712B7E|nr:prostate-associated microseminoprotein [Thalassophryne amazonica]
MRMDFAAVKWVLGVAGFLLWSRSSCAAPMQCHFNSKALCVFEGRHYSLGDTWMDSCLQCTCLHPVGVGCCETVHRPVDFPAWCKVQVEPVSCRVSLVQTADPRLPCIPGEDKKDPSHGSLQLQQELE